MQQRLIMLLFAYCIVIAGIAQDKPKTGLGKILNKADTLLRKVDEKIKSLITPPKNLTPADGHILTEKEKNETLAFTWTAVSPLPKEGVYYLLRVFEVKKGQSPLEAAKSGKVLVEKTIKEGTTSVWDGKVAQRWPIAEGSKYGWYVEALNMQGKAIIASSPTIFSDPSPCGPGNEMKNTKAECGQDGKVQVTGEIVITPKTTITVNAISITEIKETNFSGPNVSTTITIFPKPLTASGNTYSFSFTINNEMCNKDLYIGYTINYTCSITGQTITLPCGDYIKNIPCCKCTTCDQVKWTLPDLIKYDTSIFRGTNNIMTLYGNISFGPQKIIKLSAEIVDFYWYTEGDCKKCNTNDYYFGNLVSGSVTGLTATSVADETGIPLISSHQIDFISPTLGGVTLNNPIALNISLPPQTQLSCCTDCFRFCIRYTATFMENGVCKTCTIVKCYESKRKHRQTGLQSWPQPNQCGDIIFPPHGGGGVLQNQLKKN